MIGATDEDVCPRPEIQCGWHAIINWITVDDGRHIFRNPGDHYWMQRIYYIYAAYGNIGSRVSVSYEKRVQWRVIDHPAETSRRNCSYATSWCTRACRAKDAAGHSANRCGKLWPMVARNVRIETNRSRVTGDTARDRRPGHPGSGTRELERRIRAHKTACGIRALIVNKHGVVVLGGAVIINLAKDA